MSTMAFAQDTKAPQAKVDQPAATEAAKPESKIVVRKEKRKHGKKHGTVKPTDVKTDGAPAADQPKAGN